MKRTQTRDHDDPEEDDGAERKGGSQKKRKKFTEFDCPDCQANNPYGDGFRVGEELQCQFCSKLWRVRSGAEEDTFRLVEA